MLAPWKKSYDQTRQHIKKQRHYFADKRPSSQSYGFSSSHVWMWELDHKESWVPKNWCFWSVMLEKTLESPLDCKEIKPVNPKGNQSWIFIGRTDAKAEAPVLWPPDVKNWLIGIDPDAGKDWRWEEKGTTEDEMVGWYASLTWWTWVWARPGSWWWTDREAWHAAVHGVAKSQIWLSDWTELMLWAYNRLLRFALGNQLSFRSIQDKKQILYFHLLFKFWCFSFISIDPGWIFCWHLDILCRIEKTVINNFYAWILCNTFFLLFSIGRSWVSEVRS